VLLSVLPSINVVLGAWLIASPWVFDYSGRSPVLNSVLAGALIALLAAIRLASQHESANLNRISLLLGFWTIVSPWEIGYVANKSGFEERPHGGSVSHGARHMERARPRD
jgi:hypothetical protein